MSDKKAIETIAKAIHGKGRWATTIREMEKTAVDELVQWKPEYATGVMKLLIKT